MCAAMGRSKGRIGRSCAARTIRAPKNADPRCRNGGSIPALKSQDNFQAKRPQNNSPLQKSADQFRRSKILRTIPKPGNCRSIRRYKKADQFRRPKILRTIRRYKNSRSIPALKNLRTIPKPKTADQFVRDRFQSRRGGEGPPSAASRHRFEPTGRRTHHRPADGRLDATAVSPIPLSARKTGPLGRTHHA